MAQYKYLLLAAAILIGTCGQLMLKSGAVRAQNVTEQLISPWTFIGLFCYFLAAVAYMISLRHIPLSIAYPSVSVSYVVVLAASHLIWGEPLGWSSFAGVGCIGIGIFLIHYTA